MSGGPSGDELAVRQFSDELDRLVHRYSTEADMTYAAMIGCLHCKAHWLIQEAAEAWQEKQDEEGQDEWKQDHT